MDWERIKNSIVDPENARLARWQSLTVVLMVAGYSGYYLCRSNLAVAMPYIIRDMVRDGYDPDYARVALGTVASVGVFAYAIGKFVAGAAADLLGGRRSFLVGMGGSIACTMLFALSGTLPIFTVAWVFNRIFQSSGWVGMVKLSSRWFSYSSYGTVMGILSLSYLFGDAASRAFMGALLEAGFDWAGVFFIAASILLILLLLSMWLLRESPADIGEREPHASPTSLFADEGDTATVEKFGMVLRRLLRSTSFLSICALSLGFTLIRETFNTWTPLYFTQSAGLSPATAAQSSALFPLLGGISVVLAGILSDRLGASGRAAVIFIGLLFTATTLLVLGWVDLRGSQWLPVVLVAVTGFVMIGPYSYLGGAIALDLGGKQASATAAGIIDGIGYLGGVLAGDTFARLSIRFGWDGAFGVLAAVAILSCVPATLLLKDERRATRRARIAGRYS